MSRVFPDAAQSPLRTMNSDTPASSIEAQKWAEIWNQAWKQSLGEVESGPAVVLK
ncbi:hypothetical protein H0H93_001102 [Arthromyces matolae]|nr:hypothetical protein H0H93_001102 [Arthromyces matolae]